MEDHDGRQGYGHAQSHPYQQADEPVALSGQ
jgi:hypothetical protein